jgi:hypothetical protein
VEQSGIEFKEKKIRIPKKEEVLGEVAHSCNPSYLGGGDQEDCGSEPAQEKT